MRKYLGITRPDVTDNFEITQSLSSFSSSTLLTTIVISLIERLSPLTVSLAETKLLSCLK